MKNKNADILLPEALKLVLALIAIGFLLILAFQLYGILTAKHELEQARATLEQVIGKARGLDEQEELSYIITAPKDWFLVSYNGQLPKNRPAQCNGKDCLCLCKLSDYLKRILDTGTTSGQIFAENYLKKFVLESKTEERPIKGVELCQEYGVCEDLGDEEIWVFEKATFKTLGVRSLDPFHIYWIPLHQVPKEIILRKSKPTDLQSGLSEIPAEIRFEIANLDEHVFIIGK